MGGLFNNKGVLACLFLNISLVWVLGVVCASWLLDVNRTERWSKILGEIMSGEITAISDLS